MNVNIQNKVQITLKLEKEPDVHYFQSGGSVVTCTCRHPFINNEGEEKTAFFIEAKFWFRENEDPDISDKLAVGEVFEVVGELRRESWKDKNTDAWKEKWVINNCELLVSDREPAY